MSQRRVPSSSALGGPNGNETPREPGTGFAFGLRRVDKLMAMQGGFGFVDSMMVPSFHSPLRKPFIGLRCAGNRHHREMIVGSRVRILSDHKTRRIEEQQAQSRGRKTSFLMIESTEETNSKETV